MNPTIVVLISANSEWRAVRALFAERTVLHSPFGGWFLTAEGEYGLPAGIIFFHGGWGKIAAAASTQYVIDRWKPDLLVNLGTCGGFEGAIGRGAILLVERTVVYDILEQMGDQAAALTHYSTNLDLDWLALPYPVDVEHGLLVSGDRDLVPGEIAALRERYTARAGDWESGAIAWVCARNQARVLILRGVSDLVSPAGGEAYDNIELFHRATSDIMARLVGDLHHWLAAGGKSASN